jgi:hypothetical protein
VQGAFQLFVTQFQEVTTYAAVINRLSALWEATGPQTVEPSGAGPLPRAPADSETESARPADSTKDAGRSGPVTSPVTPFVKGSK